MFADLHLHSTYSDGTDTPDELILLAKKSGIKAIAISDHDSIAGYCHIADTGNSGVMIIPSVEISTVLGHSYLHVLGYYIDTNAEELAAYIRRAAEEKTENTRINFENARNQGCFHYTWERVLELNRGQPRISGVHVVHAMEKDGCAVKGMGLWDMFRKYFRAESHDFIPTETATAYDAIDIIKKAGGIPVIAHPKSIGDDAVVHDLIQYGVQGLEVFHPTHTKNDIEKYRQLAQANQLYITGGTDWHGKNNGPEITRFGMCGLENDGYPILSARPE